MNTNKLKFHHGKIEVPMVTLKPESGNGISMTFNRVVLLLKAHSQFGGAVTTSATLGATSYNTC